MNSLFKSIDIDYESKIQLFKEYVELFLKYNSKVNLIGRNDEKYLLEKHIYDSLAVNLFFKKYNLPRNMLDIGTGGGFPSLPVAIYFSRINVYAVDSIGKKIKFINDCAEMLGLKNIKTINKRVEELPENLKNLYDVAAARAMADLREILEYAVPFVKTGGYFVAYKSLKADEEIQNAQNALKVLNTKLIDKIDYKLPLEENSNRVLLIFKKLKPTDIIYPRKNGAVKKNPL